MVNDLDAAALSDIVSEIESSGGTVLPAPGSVTDPAFPAQFTMKRTIEAFGKINVLVNNAGYTWDGMIHKMT